MTLTNACQNKYFSYSRVGKRLGRRKIVWWPGTDVFSIFWKVCRIFKDDFLSDVSTFRKRSSEVTDDVKNKWSFCLRLQNWIILKVESCVYRRSLPMSRKTGQRLSVEMWLHECAKANLMFWIVMIAPLLWIAVACDLILSTLFYSVRCTVLHILIYLNRIWLSLWLTPRYRF